MYIYVSQFRELTNEKITRIINAWELSGAKISRFLVALSARLKCLFCAVTSELYFHVSIFF